MPCKRKEPIRIYKRTYAGDGKGGRKRAWHKAGRYQGKVTFQNARDKITGQVLGEMQTATIEVTRHANIEQGDRGKMGGVEYEVVALDPMMRSPRRKVYLRRVNQEELDG